MSTDPTAVKIQTNVKKNLDPTIQRMTGITFHGGMHFDVPFISPITDNLWQGGSDNQLILPHFFKHWVTLAPWYMYKVKHELESFVSVKMYDSLDQATDQIDAIANWVNVCRLSGPVALTCQAGLNRSSLVAARALMLGPEKLKGWEAVKLLREKRDRAVLCNTAFERYIKDFDK